MKIKLDENIPNAVAILLRDRGLDVDTVLEESLGGRPDPEALTAATREDRLLITLDRGFGDIRAHPPGGHPGIIALRPNDQRVHAVTNMVETLINSPSDRVLVSHSTTTRCGPDGRGFGEGRAEQWANAFVEYDRTGWRCPQHSTIPTTLRAESARDLAVLLRSICDDGEATVDEKRGSAKHLSWCDDAITRRAVFGMLGLTALTTACGSGGSGSASASTTSAAQQPTAVTVAPATTTPATSTTEAATTEAATVAPTTTPPTATAAVTTPSTEAVSAVAPPTSAAVGGSEASIVPGINVNITDAILTDDARSYGGSWTAAWSFDDQSGSGTITANVIIDVPSRSITSSGSVTGPLFADPVPAISTTVSVDSYIYDDNGHFRVDYPTVLGPTDVTSDGGFGKFKLHIDLVGRADAIAFDAAGVANRPSLIPITFTITATDGTKRTGTIQGKPG